jgi:hypothetical protein
MKIKNILIHLGLLTLEILGFLLIPYFLGCIGAFHDEIFIINNVLTRWTTGFIYIFMPCALVAVILGVGYCIKEGIITPLYEANSNIIDHILKRKSK